MNYFVTAIGTDSGKTVISAIISLALEADYWKPVQAGFPTDTSFINELTKGKVHCHPEQFVLNTPASPHAAAPLDDIVIKLDDFKIPSTKNNLVIEGAGGIMVPLNDKDLVIDLALKFNYPVILVSNNYLGSINHTLLSIDYLRQRRVELLGIVFNGPPTPSTEEIILKKTAVPCLLKIPQLNKLDDMALEPYVNELRERLHELD